MCAMARGLPDTVAEFAQAPPLRADVPLIVLTAATSEESLRPPGIGWFLDVDQLQRAALEAHQTFARQSSKGRWAIVPGSTHLIASSQPERVADEVLTMVDSIR